MEHYFAARPSHQGIKAARAQYDAWRAVVRAAQWKTPGDVKRAHPDMERPVKYLSGQAGPLFDSVQTQVNSSRGSACRRLITLIFVDRAQGPPSWS